MLVAGNDRVQAVITQMEEVCQTIEVSSGWQDRGDKVVRSESPRYTEKSSLTSGQAGQKVSRL